MWLLFMLFSPSWWRLGFSIWSSIVGST